MKSVRFARWLASLTLMTASVSHGQGPTPGAVPTISGAQGAALTVQTSELVNDFVGIQAVLLPYKVTSELFSKHIAQNYVAVVVNISNRSREASLVLQGLYLDYGRWALSGTIPNRESVLEKYSSATYPGEVSSIEYRIVRGELEERQPKTARNWTLRSLQLVGALAAASTFPFGPQSTWAIKGIAEFNGVAIPGFERLWPDSLITKLNRISDFGYRVNRLIPRESSDVVVAFFPIDRFITPGLKKIFITQPAAFFNPGLAVVDKNTSKDLLRILENIGGQPIAELRQEIPHMLSCRQAPPDADQEECDKSRALRQVVAATSMNNIALVVDGSMVVDISTTPASR